MSSEELVRVSDAEREHAVARLRDASAAGRLTLEELSDRTGLAYAAATRAELEQVVVDLPAAELAPLEPQQRMRLFLGLFWPIVRRGRWRVAPRTVALSLFAPCALDLRKATFPQAEATLFVLSLFGPIAITVPEHLDVDLKVFTVLGPTIERGNPGELPAGAPRLRVLGASLFGPVFLNYRRS